MNFITILYTVYLAKVFWEPFIEPWQLEIGMTRKQELSLNSSIVTDLHLKSIEQLNLDFTEPLIEVLHNILYHNP